MSFVVASFPNICRVEFDMGSFDEWCVYVCLPNEYGDLYRYAPKDEKYFSELVRIGNIHGKDKLYNDFVSIYKLTNKKISKSTIDLILNISKNYGSKAEDVLIWFTVIYAAMVAEENKENTVLGKRIKRLGIHQILIDGESPLIASNFSKKKPAMWLDKLCREKGF